MSNDSAYIQRNRKRLYYMNSADILKQLDSPEAVHWHPDFNNAKGEAYEFVSSALSTMDLTENQRVNALRCLFYLRFHVPEERAFADLRKHCRSGSLRERSIAVRLATALIGLSEAFAIPSRSFTPSREDWLALQEGLKMGVDEATEKLATKILRNRP